MVRNYFKIVWRNLLQQKTLAFINIFGLSIGIACFTLFLLYALNEYSFDNFHKNVKDIYRVCTWNEPMNNMEAGGNAYDPIPLGPALKQDLVGVENYVRFFEAKGIFVKSNNMADREDAIFADSSFFSVFSFKLKSGNSHEVLRDVHSVVLTEEISEKMFGKYNPVGKTIQIKLFDKYEPFLVTAIAENPPSTSTIQFKMIANFNYLGTTALGASWVENWNVSGFQTYVQLIHGNKLPFDKSRLAAFRKKYYPDEEEGARKNLGWTGKGSPFSFKLEPFYYVHLDTNISGAGIPPINPKTIWILLSIAGGVLLIACINFTTLSIGRSAGRSKEIGVRKVVGAGKKQLVFQFLTEALFLSDISAIIGLLISKLLLPYFNELSDRHIEFSFAQHPELIWLFIGLVLLVSLVAGIYPAFVLSNFKPIEILKSKIRVGGSNIFTKSLMTLQFALSMGLIISTIVIVQQTRFMSNKNPGFDKENVVLLDASGIDAKKIFPTFKQELSNHPEITGVSSATSGLGEGEEFDLNSFKYKDKQIGAFFSSTDADYIRVLGMQLIAGRDFDPLKSEDTVTSVIINEALMNDLGWTVQEAIGQQLKGFNSDKTPIVIGVVRNFNFRPLTEKVTAQLFCPFFDQNRSKWFIRIGKGNPASALALIQKEWSSLVPDFQLKYSFLDEKIDNYYKAEQRWSSILGWAGGISIFLGCLGLLGLASLAVINRTKEIGIRKILGASLSSIFSLLSKDFLKLILFSFIISAPIVWYFMNKWLLDFAYRIDISWWVFAITGAGTILISLITVSFQAFKAAVASPVNSLRME
jgi:putative ABC transport system permease protein